MDLKSKSSPKTLTGWRYGLFLSTIVGGIGLAVYFVIVQPYLHPEKWQELQKRGRAGLDVEKIQPGGMKVWTDPFDKSKDKK